MQTGQLVRTLIRGVLAWGRDCTRLVVSWLHQQHMSACCHLCVPILAHLPFKCSRALPLCIAEAPCPCCPAQKEELKASIREMRGR